MEKEYWRSEARPRRAAAAAAVAAVSGDGKDRAAPLPAIWKNEDRSGNAKTAHRIRGNNGRFMPGVQKKGSKGQSSGRKSDDKFGEARKERSRPEAEADDTRHGGKGESGRESDKKRKRNDGAVKSGPSAEGELKESSSSSPCPRTAKKGRSKLGEKSGSESSSEVAAPTGGGAEYAAKGKEDAPIPPPTDSESSSAAAIGGGSGTAGNSQQLHSDTIGAIRAVLRCYAPRDPLDEDEIVQKVARHRDETILRRRKRRAEEDPFSAYYSSSDEMEDIMGAPDCLEAAQDRAPARGGLFDAILARRRTRLTDFDEEMDQAAFGGIDPAFFRSIIAAASSEASKLKGDSHPQTTSACPSQDTAKGPEKETASLQRTLSVPSKPASLSSISAGLDQKTVATLRRRLGMLGEATAGATLATASGTGFPTTNTSSEVAALLDLKGVMKKKRRRLATSPVPEREGGKGEPTDDVFNGAVNEPLEGAPEGLEPTDATDKPASSAEADRAEQPSSADAEPGTGADGATGTSSGSRRFTRGMARDNRLRRREERDIRENMGLDALVFAANEIDVGVSDVGKGFAQNMKKLRPFGQITMQRNDSVSSATAPKPPRKIKKKKGVSLPLHEAKKDEKSFIASSDEGDVFRGQWKEGISKPDVDQVAKGGESSSSSSIDDAFVRSGTKMKDPTNVGISPESVLEEEKTLHDSSSSKMLDTDVGAPPEIAGATEAKEPLVGDVWSLSNAWKGSKNPHLVALVEGTTSDKRSNSLAKPGDKDSKTPQHNATIGSSSGRSIFRVVRVVVGGELVALGPPKKFVRRSDDEWPRLLKGADKELLNSSKEPPAPSKSHVDSVVVDRPNEEKAPTSEKSVKATNDKKEVTVPRPNKMNRPRKSVPVPSKKKPKSNSARLADGVKLASLSHNRRPAVLRDPVFAESVWVSGTDGTLESPVSLSLLDWRRRQQKTPQTKQKATKTRVTEDEAGDELIAHNRQVAHIKQSPGPVLIPTAVGTAKIDAGLPMWESINPYSDVAKQAAATEPARRRHADRTYASWCSGLINCLNGSGRSMARYEFFYSDIDRAWFNSSQFDVDLANMGIPKCAKLSRSEWSAVRRRLPNRPRRFSKSFIQRQLGELERYRRWVRTVQTDRERAPAEFDFEVPAPIKVGTTVTAYNKTARILHRGIVLSHDTERSRYLIQFERKELGYEYCPDTEVARHGVPDLMVPASQTAVDGTYIPGFTVPHLDLGSLPYGTCYGPLFGFNTHEASAAPGTDDIAEVDDDTRHEVANDNMSRSCRSLPTLTNGDGTMSVVKKVAERETLARLMGSLEDMTRRKEMILDILNKFHDYFEKEGDGDSSRGPLDEKEARMIREHYAWLHGNLQLNNERLEAALVHLKVMYGNVYAGRNTGGGNTRVLSPQWNKAVMQRSLTGALGRGGEPNVCLRAVSEKSVDVSKKVMDDLEPLLNGKTPPGGGVENGALPWNSYLENRATGAGSLLFVVRYLEHKSRLTANRKLAKTHMNGQSAYGDETNVLARMLDNLRPSARLPSSLEQWNSARDKEFEALSEALSMLDGELAAAAGGS